MSESSDIYKYTQTAEYKARLAKARLEFLAEQTEMENYKRRSQDACSHLDSGRRWAFNLVHNFPDMLPRGLCPLCWTFIQPRHWEVPKPNQPVIVDEHPLYPVVRWMEQLDYTLAKLEQEYIRDVDSLLAAGHLKRHASLTILEQTYQQAQVTAHHEFDRDTEQYKPVRKESK